MSQSVSSARSQSDALRLRALAAGLTGRKITILHQETAGHFDFAENVPANWRITDLIGLTDDDVWDQPFVTQLREAKARVRSTGEPQTLELELRDNIGRHIFEAVVAPDFTPAGEAAGLMLTFADVTEVREREMALSSLMREVSHRSKNLLAIVQAVAMQTAHHSDTVGDFLTKFRGRLHALAGTQDLVTESNWRGTMFQSLVVAQLARVGQTSLESVHISGDNPMLGPNAALHIGLALHELAANAVVYGALADHNRATVDVSAKVELQRDAPANLVVRWEERGLKNADASRQPRFGTLVLQKIVPLSVGGSAVYSVEPNRVRYQLDVPNDQFEL